MVLQPEEDGGYSIVCPAIQGCVSEGDNLEEALANIKEAIELCLEVIAEEGQPVPVETPELVTEEIRECLNDRAGEGLLLTIETREVEIETGVAV